MKAHGVVSADSHVTEPADLWVERLDRRYRDRSPKVVPNPDPKAGGYLFVAETAAPMFVGGVISAGASGAELAESMTKGLEAARPSGWDPIQRIADQDIARSRGLGHGTRPSSSARTLRAPIRRLGCIVV